MIGANKGTWGELSRSIQIFLLIGMLGLSGTHYSGAPDGQRHGVPQNGHQNEKGDTLAQAPRLESHLLEISTISASLEYTVSRLWIAGPANLISRPVLRKPGRPPCQPRLAPAVHG